MKPPLTAFLSACAPRWLRDYRREFLVSDLLAGCVVAIMLVPQSMAYALVAGLPAQYGMYASILPLLAYAWFGTSMTLAVGPVAVTSLMTAAALAPLAAAAGSAEYIAGAGLLALLSGALLLVLGLLRFGFVAKLLSNPVISGFTSGSSLLILVGQLGPLLGVPAHGGNAGSAFVAWLRNIGQLHVPTAAMGLGALALLVLSRNYLPRLLRMLGVDGGVASLIAKLAPMAVVIGAIVVSTIAQLAAHGVAVIGTLPQGLPPLGIPTTTQGQLVALLPAVFAIGLVNFVSSISVAQALAARRKERIDADAELRALGAANIASALSGGLPVSGGFSRSMVNDSAGALTPLSGVVSASMMLVVAAVAASVFTALPVAVLAATIVVAVAPVIDIGALRRAWHYDRADAIALAATACGVIVGGVEAGIALGIGISLVSLVWRSSHPHIAVVGRVPFTEHFRNVLRYRTETLPHVLALRIDENLLFANAQAVEARVRAELEAKPGVLHVLLVLSSVSQIDYTALEMLEELNDELRRRGIALHFSELKGPVLQRLGQTSLLQRLSGQVFLSTHQAFQHFSGATEDYSI